MQKTFPIVFGNLTYDTALENWTDKAPSFLEARQAIAAPTTTPLYRLHFLNPDDTVKSTIPLEDIVRGSGSLDISYQNGTRRTLSLTLVNLDGKYTPSVSRVWYDTKIGLDLGIGVWGHGTLWVPAGVFCVNSATPAKSADGQKTVQLSCSDKWSVFESKRGSMDDTTEIPEGQNIPNAIKGIILNTDDSGLAYDYKEPYFSPHLDNLVTQQLSDFSAGQTLSEILLSLATQASAEMFYDVSGRLNVLPYDETMLITDKPILDHYDADKGDVGDVNLSFDMASAINKIVVVGQSNTAGYHRAAKINDSPSSPISASRIGTRTKVVNDPDISTDYLAEERATYELRQVTLLKTSVQLIVPFNPFVDVNQIITLSDSFYKMEDQRFVITAASVPLDDSGMMSISCSNTENLPFLMQ